MLVLSNTMDNQGKTAQHILNNYPEQIRTYKKIIRSKNGYHTYYVSELIPKKTPKVIRISKIANTFNYHDPSSSLELNHLEHARALSLKASASVGFGQMWQREESQNG